MRRSILMSLAEAVRSSAFSVTILRRLVFVFLVRMLFWRLLATIIPSETEQVFGMPSRLQDTGTASTCLSRRECTSV